jgi:hypothetical protein
MAILKTLTINGVTYRVAQQVETATITLRASAWVGDNKRYSQTVNIAGVTAHSRVDLKPSVEQIEMFYEKDVTFSTENNGGVVTVYVVGEKPENDYTMQVDIVEVTA